MSDVDPQRARDVRAGISKPVWKIGIKLDCVAGARDVDAILHRHLELSFENEPELITLVVQRHRRAGGPGFVSVLGQLVTAFGIIDPDSPLYARRGTDDLL